jgi:Na+/H+ antiporter NhaD/arsenite permease-like protein
MTTAPVASHDPVVLSMDGPMMVSAIVLFLTFAGIFTEAKHGVHRTKVAMTGAAVMVFSGQIFGFYGPEEALEAIDWNVIFLLASMMVIIAIMIPTGGFQAISFWIARISRGRQYYLLAMLGTAVTLLSLLLDNVTTVIIFGPLIILISQVLRVSPIPYLLAAALLSDTGGVATLVGDPPNLMIGSAADIDFNTFFLRMVGPVVFAWLSILLVLRVLFWKDLSVKPEVVEFAESFEFEDRKTWNLAILVLGIMVVLFILHRTLHWEAWVVAATGLTSLFLLGRKASIDPYLEKVEHALLLFFISLFVLIGGVEHSHFLQYIGQQIIPLVSEDLLLASLLLLWVAALLSAAIDNIPFTAAMIPIILSMEAQGMVVTPLWWSLAMGVGMGGNGTHIGSTANVFIVTLSERLAQRERNRDLAITPGLWFRKGTPAMLLTLVVCSACMIMFFDFFMLPIHHA